jgi:hypothetical protein
MVRTDWAMRMIYGVLRYNMRGENFTPMNNIVHAIGFGTANCKVYDYWKKDSPVEIHPKHLVKNIVLRNGNKAILILASWSETALTAKIRFKDWEIISAKSTYPAAGIPVKNGVMEVKLGKYGMQLIQMEVK